MDMSSFDLQTVGALSSIVGLLPSFAGWFRTEYLARKTKRREQAKDVVEQYIEWLHRKRHKEILNKISGSQEALRSLEKLVEQLIVQSKEDRKAVLKRLENVDSKLSGKLDGIDGKIDNALVNQEEILMAVKSGDTVMEKDAAKAEVEYRKVLKEELGSIKMLGSPDVPNVPVDLLDTFVSLDITTMSVGKYREGLEPNEMRGETDRKLSPEDTLKRAFEKNRMLLILGDPGSGKTTLVKYYAMLCLKNRFKKLGFKEATLPIYLPLREVETKDGELCPLHECLTKWASRHYLSISADTFLGWLQNRATLIMLDGLDEISDLDKRKEICDWIDNAATGLIKAKFVVTSRWTGYRKVDGIELEFDHVKADVRDFSKEQQAEFLEKWFVAAYLKEPQDKGIAKHQWRKKQKQKGKDKAKLIVDFLAEEENKGVRDLAVVPMLLQVIAILWRERENLPQGRAELYQAALKYLLDYRDRRKKIKPLMPATQALRVLCPVSFWMQGKLHADEVQKDKLYGKMEKKLANMKDSVPADEFCENLRDRAGLIADYGRDLYVFRHKSFREYLAGQELVTQARRDAKCLEKIVKKFGEDWWNEPLRFFMGEVDDELFDQFMDALFKSNASKELDQKSYSLLLAMVSEAPERRIDSLVKRLNAQETTENQKRYIVDCLNTIGNKEAIEAIDKFVAKQIGTEVGGYAAGLVVGNAASGKYTTDEVVSEAIAKVDVFKKFPKSFRNIFEFNAEYIRIPGGSFKYSVSKKMEPVPDLYFAKYPVTNKRYRRFIGYLAGRDEELSEVLPLKVFSERMLESAKDVKGFEFYLDKPRGWAEKLKSGYDDEKRFKGDDQPMVGVSWFDAKAYCYWLSLLNAASMGWPLGEFKYTYRLPKEVEWEWAASGGKREYPWPAEKGGPSDKLANYNQNVGATTPVGRYPEGTTPEGLMDMAGNVWEWMENWDENYVDKYRSLRGGSWLNLAYNLRCVSRFDSGLPVNRSDYDGFRVVFSQS
ncbi:MAG: SUMF1/EgtB/PvdO family nonheme iron enzyme [Syntrophaceae bacterium]|nr:SUMF1/EgtB/PvdO family nonheme iron enzyme [Syntrophaceae bacterium]